MSVHYVYNQWKGDTNKVSSMYFPLEAQVSAPVRGCRSGQLEQVAVTRPSRPRQAHPRGSSGRALCRARCAPRSRTGSIMTHHWVDDNTGHVWASREMVQNIWAKEFVFLLLCLRGQGFSCRQRQTIESFRPHCASNVEVQAGSWRHQ